MVEKTKRHKKGSISEEDISTLLQRYTATTVLALLQEVAQVSDAKIDWNALVKRTTTGISSAREYQMLWRHLAYRDSLLERLDNGAEPLDDDSDLEYELEAFPAVSCEASTEAAACVKVLVASVAPNDSSLSNGATVEAPLTINIPNGQSARVPSENSQLAIQGTNITVPVSVQKQPLHTVTSAEGLDANGSAGGSLPARRKRKPWSAAEDLELIAAVQKCGEGNWANILKGDFKGDRTASQLSQRWAIIRKRQGNLNVGGGSQYSEAHLATRHVLSLALNMPMDNLTAACSMSTGGTNSNTMPSNSSRPTVGEAPSVGGSVSQAQNQSQLGSVPTTTAQTGTSGPSSKSRVTSKKTSVKSPLGPDALVKAAAVYAGARIASPSDAASLLKAAQANNAVHIMAGGSSLIKPSGAGNTNSLPSTHLAGLPNVHYIRTGLAAIPLSSYSAAPSNASWSSVTQVQGHSMKPAVPTVQLNPSSTATASNTSSEATNVASSNSAMEVDVKIAKDGIGSGSGDVLKEQVQEDQVAVSGNELQEQIQEDQTVVPGNAPKEQVQEDQASVSGDAGKDCAAEDQSSISGNAPKEQAQEDPTALPNSTANLSCEMDFVENSKHPSSVETVDISNQVTEGKIEQDEIKVGGKSPCSVEENCENQIVDGKQDASSMIIDGSDEKMELLSEAAAGT
ncbi:uncharacterized protein LOC132276072 [Cornus florida]|uniref:uncharacterized protein LOC132276072 n=1 Tax=Cornus florida TaxID=4283 RepID=UPI00289CB11C|nr:uncharacterized protein LOC132276072 [Cornus florida]